MNEQLEQWFATREEKKKQRALDEKKDVLRAAGLYSREYGKESEEYPLYDAGTFGYYKENFVEVTDEEYERIKRIVEEEKSATSDKNRPGISMILKVISMVVLVCGIIVALGALNISFEAFLTALLSPIPSATVLWALSVVIDLLYDIKNK
ncbi:MAG: hypothetical protein IJX13_04990 [Clostridia bacterium]|nr:hypothetical protein [Clostridia bacterium]